MIIETAMRKKTAKIYTVTESSKPEAIFPRIKKLFRKDFTQSPVNPDYVRTCTENVARGRAKQIRKEGWAAQVCKFKTNKGDVWLVYERRTGRELRGRLG